MYLSKIHPSLPISHICSPDIPHSCSITRNTYTCNPRASDLNTLITCGCHPGGSPSGSKGSTGVWIIHAGAPISSLDMAWTPRETGTFAGIGIVAISGPGIMLGAAGNRVDHVCYFHISLFSVFHFLVLVCECLYARGGDVPSCRLSFMLYFGSVISHSASLPLFVPRFTTKIIHRHQPVISLPWKKI